jgi:hypothetical protein
VARSFVKDESEALADVVRLLSYPETDRSSAGRGALHFVTRDRLAQWTSRSTQLFIRTRGEGRMKSDRARSLWTALTATVIVGLAASLIGCASAGPVTPVVVSDVKSVAGTWKGIVYRSSTEPEQIVLTIREDGSYDLVSAQPLGTSRGKGTMVVSNGRLVIEGERGRGVATVLKNPAGDRVMNVEATLSDNTILTAKLWPSP